MVTQKVKVNRAPVLTLWGAVVAERLGFDWEEALTLGRAVAGLNAQAKGQRLGIFEAGKEKGEKARERERGQEFLVEIVGRPVPAINTEEGIRATTKGQPIEPETVQRYLQKKFKADLAEVRAAMEELATSLDPEKLADEAYPLYEKFRPDIPEGKKGWGAEGELDLDYIRSLAKP